MASEIQCAHTATGKNLYALIRNSTGSVWNGTSFVSYATANLSSYAIALTEQGTASRYYAATFSSSIASGVYNLAVYERQGGSPAEGDPSIAVGQVEWNGSSVVAIDSRLATSGYTAPDNSGISAIKTQTDKFGFDGSNYVNAHTKTNDDKTSYALTSAYDPAKTASQAGDAMDLVANAVDASALAADAANEIADALLDRSNGIETSYTLRQALRIILSALAGKLSGAASTTVYIRDVGDSKDRITATVDSDGNRTAMTLDAT